MKKQIMRQLLLPASLTVFGALSLVSCQDEDFGYEAKDIKYETSFANIFGNINPDNDWNAAGRFTANVDLSGISSSECDVLVFNGRPLGGGELAAHYKVDGAMSFQLDLPKNIHNAFVLIADKEGKIVFNQYVRVVDNELRIAQDITRGTTEDVVPNFELREVTDRGTFWNGSETLPYPDMYYIDDESIIKNGESANAMKDMYVLVAGNSGNNLSYTIGKPSGYNYVKNIENGYFAEGVNNRKLYKEKFSKDVILTTSGGEVQIANEFGATDYTNQFGYYYYEEGSTPEETLQNKIAAKKYVAIRRSEPSNNIVIRRASKDFEDEHLGTFATKSNGGMTLAEEVANNYLGEQAGWSDDDLIVGTKYRLVYFEEGKDPSYNFPEGLKIGFFYNTLSTGYMFEINDQYKNEEKNGGKTVYSDSELNAYYQKFYSDESGIHPGVGDWKAVTYSINTTYERIEADGTKITVTEKKVIMGFEDGSDNDMNDILFWVQGVKEDMPEIEVNTEKQTWIIASEDLGGTHDYDFNDVVFSVTHVAGENTAVVTPMASGGTLPVYVYYKENKISELEFHKLFNENAPYDKQINAESRGTEGTPVEVTVDEDFTLSYNETNGVSNMGGLDVRAVHNPTKGDAETGSGSNTITGKDKTKGKAPQMLLIHDVNWGWPTEGTCIIDAYPEFANFVSAPADNYNSWYKLSKTDLCVARGTKSPIETSNGGSGSSGGQNTDPWIVKPILEISSSEIFADKGGNVSIDITFGEQPRGDGSMYRFGDASKITFEIDHPELFSSSAYYQYGSNNKPQVALTAGNSIGTAIITITHPAVEGAFEASTETVIVHICAEPNLSASNLISKCGKQITLVRGTNYSSLSDGAISVASSNTDVVSVNGNVLTTQTVSSATDVTITINQEASSNKLYKAASTTFTLTVDPAAKEPATLSVTKTATLNLVAKGDAGTINKGTDFDFELGASNLGVTYSSSNEAIMTVSESNGVVTITPKKAGTAQVRIKSVENETYAESDYLVIANVTIEAAPKIDVTGKTISIECTRAESEWDSGKLYGANIWKADLSDYSVNGTVTATVSSPTQYNSFCSDINWQNESRTNTLSSDFISAAFANGAIYITDYNGQSSMTLTVTFSEAQ